MSNSVRQHSIDFDVLIHAYGLMCTELAMVDLYEKNFKQVSKYVHATSRGHEAIQLATAHFAHPSDVFFPYYRDDAMLLGLGIKPYELMLQLLAKKADPFTGGRSYYAHPSLKREGFPIIPHQSSATGMQAIPATGAAMGLAYKNQIGSSDDLGVQAVVLCSLGDASVTEGEVAEAFQMAALKQLPIIYLVQDNEWDISATADEIRAADVSTYINGFKGIKLFQADGSDYFDCHNKMSAAFDYARENAAPVLVHAKVPLLNHHTSGVRMEWYRDDIEEHKLRDPYPIFRNQLMELGISVERLDQIQLNAHKSVQQDYENALSQADPAPEDLFNHVFAPTSITEEVGERNPVDGSETIMVDCALHAIEEIMKEDKNCLFYGQDVGGRLGGVFREAATLAQKFGDHRVFNTPIQEAFIVGSTVGLSAVGLKPIVEVQFADYIFPGLNQLFTEVSRSCYLSNGKFPVSMILRVPIGAYGSGGPYHSSSVETMVANIKGIKIAYPSNGADLKGLLKSAYYDPNPVIVFEHKGLYWSKTAGTNRAKTIEPDADYVIPFGKARIALEAQQGLIDQGKSVTIITYGMGVHWAMNAAKKFDGQIEVLDLRSLQPIDYEAIHKSVQKHNKCLVLSEDCLENSFARNLAGFIQEVNFKHLDAPVITLGSHSVPAIPLNSILEKTMIPSVQSVQEKIKYLLDY